MPQYIACSRSPHNVLHSRSAMNFMCPTNQRPKCNPQCRLKIILIHSCIAKPPKVTSQPISQKDILPGKAVAFSVKATGAKPLSYQWQWRPFGEDEWKNLSAEGSTFQVEEIQACNAGYYWCVVSNSAGSETSHCASLTIGKHVYYFKPTSANLN